MREIHNFGWYYFLSDDALPIDIYNCGKWMCFFDNQKFAKEICKKAIEECACQECKCTDMNISVTGIGVICFYCNINNCEDHKKIIKFMLNNNLIRRTKTGKLFNISFKLDDQTHAGLYGKDFVSEIKLSNFLDLETGEFK